VFSSISKVHPGDDNLVMDAFEEEVSFVLGSFSVHEETYEHTGELVLVGEFAKFDARDSAQRRVELAVLFDKLAQLVHRLLYTLGELGCFNP